MSGHRMSMQEWLLEIDPLYRENYQATLNANIGKGLNHVQHVLRWQFNSAKRRAFKAGLLDEEGRKR
jgi:hypothetical protein